MIIIQEWERFEQSFGKHKFRLVIADNYDELFLTDAELGITDADKVDIFQVSPPTTKLNTDDGKFAMDEMKITVPAFIADTEKRKQALWFTYDAVSLKKNRFCVLFFDADFSTEDTLLDTIWFIGKVTDQVSGTDSILSGNEYDETIDPERDYDFKCHSFDISNFKNIKLRTKFETAEGTEIEPIYSETNPRITQAELDNIFDYRLYYALEYFDSTTVNAYLKPLGSLYKAIELLFLKGSDILSEIIGTPMTIELVPSSLGMTVAPSNFEFKQHSVEIEKWEVTDKRIKLRLDPVLTSVDNWCNPLIHRRMFDPSLNQPESTSVDNTTNQETPLSFWQFESLTELLSSIAKSFACYPFVKYKSGRTIQVEFRSRENLLSNEFTQIIDWTDGSIDLTSMLSKGDVQYVGKSTYYTTDGYDELPAINDQTREPSKRNEFDYSDKLKEQKQITDEDDYGLTLFTTAPTVIKSSNTTYTGSGLDRETTIKRFPFNVQLTNEDGKPNYSEPSTYLEKLHSSIYIAVYPLTAEQQTRLGNSIVYRPGSYVYTTIDQKEEKAETLSEMVNKILGKEKQYYETEYKITVPFWSGFKTATKEPSWKNVKLGTRIRLTETNRKTFNTDTQTWDAVTDIKDFVVVEIKRDPDKPETELKLHNVRRFAISADTTDNETGSIEVTEPTDTVKELNPNLTETFVCIETVSKGTAVMTDDNGKIKPSIPKAEYYNRTVGIALNNALPGESCKVQIQGIYSDTSLSLTPGSNVFVRKLFSTAIDNVSQTPLESPTTDEDMVMILGKAINQTSFKLDFTELIFG